MVIVRRSALPGPAPMGSPGSTPPGPACSGLRTRASHRSAPQRPATGPASGGPAHATGPASSGPALATGPACSGQPGSTPHVIETVWSLLAKEFPTIVCKLECYGQSLFFTATVGSICAGMGSEKWAVDRLPWGFRHVFWCDSCPVARKFCKGNFGDVPNWSDCMSQEFLDNAPHCNILLAGFPCQPWSIMGKGQGKTDKKGRAAPLTSIIKYIEKHHPELVMLENVAGLWIRHKNALRELIASLENMHYYVSSRILNSRTHSGIPHRRTRIYILALKLSNTWPPRASPGPPPATYRVVWPRPIECLPLSAVLDPGAKIPSYENYPMNAVAHCKTSRNNLVRAWQWSKNSQGPRGACREPRGNIGSWGQQT